MMLAMPPAMDIQWLPPAAESDMLLEGYMPWMYMPYADFPESYRMEGKAWEEASTASGSTGTTASALENFAEENIYDVQSTEWRTTVMLRNLPNALKRDMLSQMLD